MTMRGLPKVCYLLAQFRSHRRAGIAYRDCLQWLGVSLVDHPADADVVIIHDEPRHYPNYFRAFPVLRQRHVVAYAVWELNVMPEHFRFCLGLVDEVWTSSAFCRAVLAPAARQTMVVPHVVDPPAADGAADERLRGLLGDSAERFFFYMIGRFEERKNMEAAIRAFGGAFDTDVRLVVKSTNALPPWLKSLPGIAAFEGEWDDDLVQALHRLGRCFISPHCAEGWGLCISDAMAHEKLVVATGYSGNMDYMTAKNSLPVGYVEELIREPAQKARFGFMHDAAEPRWAYIDEQDLRQKLQLAHRSYDELEPMRRQAGRDMTRYLVPEVAGIIGERLAQIG